VKSEELQVKKKCRATSNSIAPYIFQYWVIVMDTRKATCKLWCMLIEILQLYIEHSANDYS